MPPNFQSMMSERIRSLSSPRLSAVDGGIRQQNGLIGARGDFKRQAVDIAERGKAHIETARQRSGAQNGSFVDLHALREIQRAAPRQNGVFRPALLRHRVKRRALERAARSEAERNAVFAHLAANGLADGENEVWVKRAGKDARRGEAGRILMAVGSVVLFDVLFERQTAHARGNRQR